MSIPGYFKFDFEDKTASTSRSTLSNNATMMDNNMGHPFAFSASSMTCLNPCSPMQIQAHYSSYTDTIMTVDPYLNICSTSPLSCPKPVSASFVVPANLNCIEEDFSSSTITESSHNFESLDNFFSQELTQSALDLVPSTSHENPAVRDAIDSKRKGGKSKSEGLVAKRNARERRRVQAVNGAFSKLRKHIPYENRNKRLSKVKTLRIAIEYIHNLEDLLHDFDLKSYCPKGLITSGSLNPSP